MRFALNFQKKLVVGENRKETKADGNDSDVTQAADDQWDVTNPSTYQFQVKTFYVSK